MPAGPAVRAATSALVGGGALTLCYHYVWPFLREHAELVAPFALANGAASALWYGVLDATLGVEALGGAFSVAALSGGAVAAGASRDGARLAALGGLARALARAPLPLGGVAVGVGTAVSAPLLWPVCIGALWPAELVEALLGGADGGSALIDAYTCVFVPVALPVCLAAGASMHALLAPLIVGIPGVAWTRSSLPALLALSAVSAAYVHRCRTPLASLAWERRLQPRAPDQTPGPPALVSRNLFTAELLPGGRTAERSAATRDVLLTWQRARSWWRAAASSLSMRPRERATYGTLGAELSARSEEAELRALLADVRGGRHRAGADEHVPVDAAALAGAARPAHTGDGALASVASPLRGFALAAISNSIEPLDLLMDLCVCATLLAREQPAGRSVALTDGRQLAVSPEPTEGAMAARNAIALCAAAELGVHRVNDVAADLCAAVALVRSAGGGGTDRLASREQLYAPSPAAAAMVARLCEHSARIGGGEASDVVARRARVLARALFAHVDTFDARLRALGIAVGDEAVEPATRRLRADERADAARRAALAAARLAIAAGVGAVIVRALVPKAGDS
ncbi:hypothetical protein KFE25_005939 [Diacronema lutheri]|uniref:Uncharacterized protein n=1 Tax=Diacronema lutheri TaxID=2081491 RepID=A0A8J5XS37_DIALT|nr:hypothetical protein KFE25_005939 [Diacronema lutheri]